MNHDHPLTAGEAPPKNAITPSIPPDSASDADFTDLATELGPCPNCGTEKVGPFCHNCGQSDRHLLKFFGSLIKEFFEDNLSWDSRFFATIYPLLCKPGTVTREFMAGMRHKFMPPLRMYLIFSLIFFFIFNFFFDIGSAVVINRDQSNQQAAAQADKALDELEKQGIDVSSERQAVDELKQPAAGERENSEKNENTAEAAPADEALTAEDVITLEPISWLSDEQNTSFSEAIKELNSKARTIPENPEPFVREALSVLPQTLFFMLPLFALVLKLIYPLSGRLYIEHFMLALHTHCFLFVALTLIMLLENMADKAGAGSIINNARYLALAVAWYIPVYLLIAQYRYYRQGKALTLLKFLITSTAYLFLLTAALAVALLIGLVLF